MVTDTEFKAISDQLKQFYDLIISPQLTTLWVAIAVLGLTCVSLFILYWKLKKQVRQLSSRDS